MVLRASNRNTQAVIGINTLKREIPVTMLKIPAIKANCLKD